MVKYCSSVVALWKRFCLFLDYELERQSRTHRHCNHGGYFISDAALVQADTVDTEILLSVLAQVRAGDFTARMPLGWTGLAGKVADGLNEVILANEALGAELARVSQVVGKEGKLSQRLVLGGWTQSWAGSVDSVNRLIDDLVRRRSRCSASSAPSPGGT